MKQWALLLFGGLTALFITLFRAPEHPLQLSIAAIFQNEERFLKEWIDFHREMGVEHFYLFNHLSTDGYQSVLQPYIEAGLVDLYDWPYPNTGKEMADWIKIQSAAYRQAIDLAKGQSKWLALLDTDEFLFPLEKKDLVDFLKDYDECCGLLVNWQIFGTAGVKKAPPDQLIEVLTLQAPRDWSENTLCKSIVRPEAVKYCVDAHTVVYYPWSYSVDPDKNIFPWKFHRSHTVKVDKIRINHYWARDEEFFYNQKIQRRAQWGDPELGKKQCLEMNAYANQIENKDILMRRSK